MPCTYLAEANRTAARGNNHCKGPEPRTLSSVQGTTGRRLGLEWAAGGSGECQGGEEMARFDQRNDRMGFSSVRIALASALRIGWGDSQRRGKETGFEAVQGPDERCRIWGGRGPADQRSQQCVLGCYLSTVTRWCCCHLWRSNHRVAVDAHPCPRLHSSLVSAFGFPGFSSSAQCGTTWKCPVSETQGRASGPEPARGELCAVSPLATAGAESCPWASSRRA